MKKNIFFAYILCFCLIFCSFFYSFCIIQKPRFLQYASFDFKIKTEIIDNKETSVTYIKNAAEFIGALNSSSSSGYFKLCANLDFSSFPESYVFDNNLYSSQTFDGNGFIITNVNNISSTAESIGFFNKNAGVIKNCVFDNLKVISNQRETISVGGIAGYNSGNIINCFIKSGYISSNLSSTTNVGGGVGQNIGGFLNGIKNSANIVSGYCSRMGGIAAYNTGTISNCHNTGTIYRKNYMTATLYCGGIAGFSSNIIKSCVNKGDVVCNTTLDCKIGGVAGYSSSIIENCVNTANVTGTTTFTFPSYAGGIVGYSNHTVRYCMSGGKIAMNVGETTADYGISTYYNFSYILSGKTPYYNFDNDYFVNFKRNVNHLSYDENPVGLCSKDNLTQKTHSQYRGYTGGIAGFATTISNVYFYGTISSYNVGVTIQSWGYKLVSYKLTKKNFIFGSNSFTMYDKVGLTDFKFSVYLTSKLYYGPICGNNIESTNAYYSEYSTNYSKSKFVKITGEAIQGSYDSTKNYSVIYNTKRMDCTSYSNNMTDLSLKRLFVGNDSTTLYYNYPSYDNYSRILGVKMLYFSGRTYEPSEDYANLVQQYFSMGSTLSTQNLTINLSNFSYSYYSGYDSGCYSNGLTDTITITGISSNNKTLAIYGSYYYNITKELLGEGYWDSNIDILDGLPYPKNIFHY